MKKDDVVVTLFDWENRQPMTPMNSGVVKRVAKDHAWVDVNWGGHTKRMKPRHLHVIPS